MGVIRGKYFTPREMVGTERVVGDWKLIDQGNGTWKHEDSGHLFDEASLQEALKMTTAKPADARIEREAQTIKSEQVATRQLQEIEGELKVARTKLESAEADAAALREALVVARYELGRIASGDWDENQMRFCAENAERRIISALATPSPGARILEKLRIAEEALEMVKRGETYTMATEGDIYVRKAENVADLYRVADDALAAMKGMK